MERAVRVIQKNKLSKRIFTEDDVARAIWPEAVGKGIAAHTSRVRLVRKKLVVEVEDAIWQRQLFTLTSQILGRISTLTGTNDVEDIEFRIAVPRRAPERATTSQPASLDEADAIADPGLRRVYRMSRKKASA